MTLDPASQKLRALPTQVVETTSGIILKRGCTEIKISGEHAVQAVLTVLTATADKGATVHEICACFAAPSRPAIAHLIEQLVTRRLLVPAESVEPAVAGQESSLEIFYWHFGASATQVTERLNSRDIVVVGVNCIARQLVAALSASGLHTLQVVDDPLLRNLRLFDAAGRLMPDQWPSAKPPLSSQEWLEGTNVQSLDCLIATSDFGAQQVMRAWNEFCVERHYHFLPVILQNLVGYVGPLVIPGETACFECLRARQNAHMEDPQTQRATEEVAYEGQMVSGFHPSMASVLGDIAAFELTKFYSGVLPLWNVGTLIEVNLLATRLVSRKVLKIPRCAVCSTFNTRSSTTPTQQVFTPVRRFSP